MVNEEAQSKRRNNRPHLWSAADVIINHELDASDQKKISMEFIRKTECLKANKPFTPDPSKDSYLSKYYVSKDFSLSSATQRKEYFKTLECTQLRKQSFFFLDYIKQENKRIASLIEQYDSEPDENQKICIKELVKQKKINLVHVESIRESISDIIHNGEECVTHFNRCWDILHNK